MLNARKSRIWDPPEAKKLLLNLIKKILHFPQLNAAFTVILLLMSITSISINVKSVSKKTITVWNVYKPAASIEFH